MKAHATNDAVRRAGRELLGTVCSHGDAPEILFGPFKSNLQASSLCNVPYLRKIARRTRHLQLLIEQVDHLPDCLDARGTRLVNTQCATSEWLANQFEIFDERFSRILKEARSPVLS